MGRVGTTYGSRLRHPLSRAAERFLDEHPKDVRLALDSLSRELADLWVLVDGDRMLAMQECHNPKCGKRIVLIDTGEYFGHLRVYGRLLK